MTQWLTRRGFVALTIACAVLYLAGGLAYVLVGSGSTLFVNDGFQYYSYLPSLVLDGDLDFTNQYEIGRENGWAPTEVEFVGTVEATGRPANAWAMGPALLWMPFFLVGLLLETLFGGGTVTGFSMWCQWPVYLGSLAYGLLGLWLLYRHVLADYEPWVRLVVVVLLVAATNLSYYLLFAGHISHGLSFFAVALHLYCLKLLYERPGDMRWYVLSGLSLGLAALVRWQDAVVGLFTLVVAIRSLTRIGSAPRAAAGFLAGFAGMLPAALVQALTWRAIYGEYFLIPQGEGWMVWTQPHLAGVLFSYPAGLLTNSPLLVLALVGLGLRGGAWRTWSLGSLLAVAASVYICAASTQWGAGESFGMRRLVAVLPLLSLGLCEVIRVAKARPLSKASVAGIALCVLWHWALLAQYFLERIRNP